MEPFSVSIKLALKVKAEEVIIHLSFDAPVTIEAITSAAVRLWPEQAVSADLKYIDTDDENILLVAEGINEALRFHSGPVLKLFVVPKGPSEELLAPGSFATAAIAVAGQSGSDAGAPLAGKFFCALVLWRGIFIPCCNALQNTALFRGRLRPPLLGGGYPKCLSWTTPR